jgi:hypothetical protein
LRLVVEELFFDSLCLFLHPFVDFGNALVSLRIVISRGVALFLDFALYLGPVSDSALFLGSDIALP